MHVAERSPLGHLLIDWEGSRVVLEVITQKLSVPNAERIFFIRHAYRAGFTMEEIHKLTMIDPWFLVQIREIVEVEEELAQMA